jgi:hypothetical protein
MLAIIGPNWLIAKDEAGQRRLDNPEDFIVIEIGAALARDIPVVPVLVDGARMPKASELPDSLKLLARRQAVQVRHTNFSSDAETLVRRLREALGYESPGRKWHVRAIIAVTAVSKAQPKQKLNARWTKALLMRKKATSTGPSPNTMRPFDSIPRTPAPFLAGALLMRKRATAT